MSEDCLSVTVWTPARSPSDGLPVYVWFYGGGFAAASGDGGGTMEKALRSTALWW
jgi:para-nitrobenzyl esterase